jgi:hypothetical protein
MEPGPEALSCDMLSVITDRLKLLATRKLELWWDIGCLLDAMATQGLAGGAGVRDWAARAKQIMGVERSEALRLRRIANLFSRELAMRFGIEKLELLVKLVETLPEAPPLMDPLRVEVLSLRDGAIVPVTFAECTAEDLRFTIKLVSGHKTTADVRFGPLGEVRDALDKALRKAMSRKAPKVKIECTHAPRQSIALVDVDPAELDALGRALVAHAKTMRKSRKRSRER